MTKAKKQKYEEKAKEDEERYNADVEKAKKAASASRAKSSDQKKAEKAKAEAPPKKALSKYQAFCKVIYPITKEANPEAKFPELTKLNAEKFKNQTATKKQLAEVEKIFNEDATRYATEKKAWDETPHGIKANKRIERE